MWTPRTCSTESKSKSRTRQARKKPRHSRCVRLHQWLDPTSFRRFCFWQSRLRLSPEPCKLGQRQATDRREGNPRHPYVRPESPGGVPRRYRRCCGDCDFKVAGDSEPHDGHESVLLERKPQIAKRSDRIRRRRAGGLIAGAIADAASCRPSCFGGPNILAEGLTPLGAIVGGVVGALLPTGGWRDVYRVK